jgi:hypothetical protein
VTLECDDGGEDDFREGDRGGERTVVFSEEVDEFVGESVGVDSRLLVRCGTAEVVFPVERLESRRLGSLREIGRVEDLKEGRREGDVGACSLDDTEEGADEVES